MWRLDHRLQEAAARLQPAGPRSKAIQESVSQNTKVTYQRRFRRRWCDPALSIGETPYAEMMGDRKDLALVPEDVAAVANMKRAGLRVVVVILSGRPLIIDKVLGVSDAVVAAWLPGTEGRGVTDVLFGDYKPTGKLSCSWPRSMDQIPINVGDQNYDPLFKYGYGLGY